MHKKLFIVIIGLAIVFIIGGIVFKPQNGIKNQQATLGTETEETIDYNPSIDPANFVTTIDNPYFSLKLGKILVYQSEDGKERNEIEVTTETRKIIGVVCVVVKDTVWVDGEMEEQTFDWFAQDTDGNVWYFGEDSKEYKNGKVVSTKGSWEAGIDGAKPGLIMKASPQVGDSWRQEYFKGEAEDRAEILSVNESVNVPVGTFENCIRVKDWSDLEPKVIENKYYCNGNVTLTITVQGGNEKHELLSISSIKL